MTIDRYSLAEVHHLKRGINHRIVFGEPDHYARIDFQRRLAAFKPGMVFGYERWTANKYGTQNWSLAVCKAVMNGPITRLPGLHPGAEIWLYALGKAQVRRIFAALDALKTALIDPQTLPERRWRALHLANRTGQNLVPIVERWAC
ncbi:MAG: DUF2840 domain-containing protein [Pseudomonadota bacterium]